MRKFKLSAFFPNKSFKFNPKQELCIPVWIQNMQIKLHMIFSLHKKSEFPKFVNPQLKSRIQDLHISQFCNRYLKTQMVKCLSPDTVSYVQISKQKNRRNTVLLVARILALVILFIPTVHQMNPQKNISIPNLTALIVR